jgi:abequosyltransferase
MIDDITLPLLTIAIPTWNRATFLALNLEQLSHEGLGVQDMVEVLVSDNASSDDTPHVVAETIAGGLPVRYIRNAENIGSDCNIAQCFNLASGQYVMILSDDDILVDGALALLLDLLRDGQYGVVALRPYGYVRDFRSEYPGGKGVIQKFSDIGEFVVKLGVFSTLISSPVISKKLLAGVDARDFCGTNLVQTYLVYQAAMAAQHNLWVDRYLVACKRNNSGGYAFSQVFVDRFGAVLDRYQEAGLPAAAVTRLESRLMTGYYPFYVWRQRLADGEDMDAAWIRFKKRFAGRWEFNLFVAPIFRLPRLLALAWGVLAITVGRVLNGDAWRGLHFLWHRLTSGKLGP